MGEARIALKLDISDAIESLGRLKREARNITGRGAGRSGDTSNVERDALRRQQALGAAMAREVRSHIQGIADKRKADKKAAADYVSFWTDALNKVDRMSRKKEEAHARVINDERKADKKAAEQYQSDWANALKERASREKRTQAEINRLHQQAFNEDRRRIRQKQNDEARHYAWQSRMEAKAYADNKRFDQQQISNQKARFSRIANFGSGGMLDSTFQAGLTRLGGMGGGPISDATRNAVTFGFFGNSFGAMGGRAARGVSSGIAGSLAGKGPLGQALGTGISGLGAVAGAALPILGALKGAQVGATVGIAQTAFGAAVSLFSSSVGTLAGAVTRLVGRGVGMARNLAITGAAGTVATTTAGVAALSARVKAETALGVVGGRNAGDLGAYGNMMSRSPGNMFSRTGIMEALTRSSAFGMNPGLVKFFMPRMMNASSIFGEDISEGMRALSRAAFQSEPEAAEKFGLNLYEKNIKQMVGNRYDLNNPRQKAEATFQAASMQLERFRGGMGAIRRTPAGAFGYTKNKTTDWLEQIGGGFSAGFKLVPRLNQLGDMIGSDKSKGLGYRTSRALGSMAGKGVDYLTSTFSQKNIGSFFSSQDEGNTASKAGDTAKAMVASIMAGAKSILQMANQLWEKLVGADGLFNRMRKQWDEFSNDWAGSIKSKIIPEIASAMDSIYKMVGEVGKEFGKGALSGATGGLIGGDGTSTGRRIATGGGAVIGGIAGAMGALPTANPFLIAGAAVTGMYVGGRAGGVVSDVVGYANGGTVPGPEGKATPAVVHAGEMILNRRQQKELFGNHMYAGGTIADAPNPWSHSILGDISGSYRKSMNTNDMRGGYGSTYPEPMTDLRKPKHLQDPWSNSIFGDISSPDTKDDGKTMFGSSVTTGLNAIVDTFKKISDELATKYAPEIKSTKEGLQSAKDSFIKNLENSRPGVDSTFQSIANALSGAGGGMGDSGAGLGTLPSLQLRGDQGVNVRGVRRQRGHHYSRVAPGTQIPLTPEAMANINPIFNALYGDQSPREKALQYHRSQRTAGSTIINNYGNQYHRGDSNSLMRLAEAL